MSAVEIIRNKKQEIIERWTAKVREKIPEARKHELPILRNDIPDLIDALADLLASDDVKNIKYKGRSHGRERAKRTQYSIDQVVREYRLLKETIFTVTDEQGDNLEHRERDAIMYAIDQAVEHACAVFFRIHTNKNQQVIDRAEKLLSQMKEQGNLRDRFIATLSHDLRGPLNNTLQLVELLEKRLDTPKDAFIDKLLEGIKLSTSRGNELVNTLLDVSLIQSGNPIPVQKSESDLLKEVRDSLEGIRPALRKRITIHSPQEQVVGYWDVRALRRAIDNLLSNAVKYGDAEGKIRITFQQTARKTTISVHNQGNPIPPKKLDKLFDPYYRTKEVKAKGWGLGLTLVRGIVEVHGGDIQVTSTPEEGTTFTLVLPTAG